MGAHPLMLQRMAHMPGDHPGLPVVQMPTVAASAEWRLETRIVRIRMGRITMT